MCKYIVSFFIFSLFFCAKLPNKPDPPYVIFQYLQKLNSNNTEQEQTIHPMVLNVRTGLQILIREPSLIRDRLLVGIM